MASTAARASVSGSASAVTLRAANPGRKGLIVVNDGAATLYVGYGATAPTSTDYTYILNAGATFEMPEPIFHGLVQGIWASATGSARVTEVT